MARRPETWSDLQTDTDGETDGQAVTVGCLCRGMWKGERLDGSGYDLLKSQTLVLNLEPD